MQPPLVGSEAPDWLATAVFDQEFVEVSLSQYKARIATSLHAMLQWQAVIC